MSAQTQVLLRRAIHRRTTSWRRVTSPVGPVSFLPLATLLLWVLSPFGGTEPAWAQEPESPASAESSVEPAGSARLMLDGRQVAGVGFSLRNDGPRFALKPIADVLDVELRIGPLGDSHTLLFDKKKVLLGPDDPTVVTVKPAGRAQEEVSRLRLAPIKTARGLEVPLEFIETTFGDELGYEIEWSFRNLELVLKRRELRQLTGSINLVHQHRFSTVEISFSERPRYRFDNDGDLAEVRLVGDSLVLDSAFSRPADPLVRDVQVAPTRIQIVLSPDAVAGEPRLVPRGDRVSMVIEVYRGRATAARPSTPEVGATVEPSLGGLRRIVIDPGHGGEETGALGHSGAVESRLTLTMARLLKARLEQRLPVTVSLTRDSDVDVPLDSRVAMANQVKADLFISLHFNSYRGSRATGAETYFLSRDASDQLAAQLAERENSVQAEQASTGQESGDLSLILWDLAQSYHLTESQRFAGLVQDELNKTLGLRDRGVRQAPFRVLMGANMPAVLVELGFISNPEEARKVQSPAYQAQLADALVRAISRFKTQLEARRAGGAGDQPSSDGDR